MISDQITKICSNLSSMTRNQKLDWKYKNADVLKHNYTTLRNRAYSMEKLNNTIQMLEKQMEQYLN